MGLVPCPEHSEDPPSPEGLRVLGMVDAHWLQLKVTAVLTPNKSQPVLGSSEARPCLLSAVETLVVASSTELLHLHWKSVAERRHFPERAALLFSTGCCFLHFM